jgi:hypothetical protein
VSEAPVKPAPEPVEPPAAILEAAGGIGDVELRASMVRTATRYLSTQAAQAAQAGKEKG